MSANWHLGPGLERLLLARPDRLARGLHLPVVHDHRPADGARDARRAPRCTPSASACSSALLIAPQTDRVPEQGRAARLADDRLRRAPVRHPAPRAARPLARARASWRAPAARPARAPACGCPAGAPAAAPSALLAAASFAGVLVLAGSPARSSAGVAERAGRRRAAAAGHGRAVVGRRRDQPATTATQIAGDVVADRRRVRAPAYRDRRRCGLKRRAGARARRRRSSSRRSPTATHRRRGRSDARASTAAASRSSTTAASRPWPRAKPTAVAAPSSLAAAPKGTPGFAKLRLTNVAPQVGLNFRQGAFRYGMSDEPPAMMGGGVCWLDYNNDGWMDLFAVNSYSDANLPDWEEHGGLPRSALFENVHGKFVNVTQVVRRGHPGQGHRLRRRRLQRRRLHRPLRHDGDRRRAALEQRQRDVHAGRARRRASSRTAGTPAPRSPT